MNCISYCIVLYCIVLVIIHWNESHLWFLRNDYKTSVSVGKLSVLVKKPSQAAITLSWLWNKGLINCQNLPRWIWSWITNLQSMIEVQNANKFRRSSFIHSFIHSNEKKKPKRKRKKYNYIKTIEHTHTILNKYRYCVYDISFKSCKLSEFLISSVRPFQAWVA